MARFANEILVTTETAHFSVDTRLTKLLGETYRSTEAALKELVDNAWDSDADHVWITLPTEPDEDLIVVRDDGSGMTSDSFRKEYLAIARDRRSRKGERTIKHRRLVKGRKGIGKFAGLAVARYMRVSTESEGRRTKATIDREEVLESSTDLVDIPLLLEIEGCEKDKHGTTIELSSLNKYLVAPREQALRERLFYEYGRGSGMQIIVNGKALSFDDARGEVHTRSSSFDGAGEVEMRFSVSDKRPQHAGFLVRVGGKVVGKPNFLGLDEDPEVPRWLLNRVFGEIEIADLPDGHVTADWEAIIENSAPFQSIAGEVRQWAREELKRTHKRDFDLRKAHLKRDIDARLSQLPEHRRAYAEAAVYKVLWKFYGEHDERFETLANVVLDALEHDEYWSVLQRIEDASRGDVALFAEALEAFGLLELAMMSERARSRLQFLDRFDDLLGKPETLEKDVHRALEQNLWVLGAKHAAMTSNRTLRTIVGRHLNDKYKGKRADERPDLLLAQDAGDRYLLIEFKRPSHELSRDDEAQVMRYRDDIGLHLPGKGIDALLIGGRRERMDTRYDGADRVVYQTYRGIVSQARYELEWLLRQES